MVSINILCLLFLIACANTNNQIPNSLSSSFDGKWDGYAQLSEEQVYYDQTSEKRIYIKAEIKDGIVYGFIGDTKIKGYISSENKLFTDPIYGYIGVVAQYAPPDRIIIETNLMSPGRIEGTYHADRFEQTPKYDWYLVKPATGKSDITISNIKVNKKELWTGKWKVESAYELNGVWAMKQEGQFVKSTRDSSFDFKGKVYGNQLKGKLKSSTGDYLPFTLEIPSDGMSFNGSLVFYGNRRYILKGKRIG